MCRPSIKRAFQCQQRQTCKWLRGSGSITSSFSSYNTPEAHTHTHPVRVGPKETEMPTVKVTKCLASQLERKGKGRELLSGTRLGFV